MFTLKYRQNPYFYASSILNFLASAGARNRKGMVMIWNAMIWMVWRHWNKIIFENGTVDLVGLLDDAKTVSWKWWLGKLNSTPPLLYEWISKPVICLAKG
jgi:hypothetical protein